HSPDLHSFPTRRSSDLGGRHPHPHGHGAPIMEYLLLKWIHIISSTFLFGTGVGSAFYKLMADLGGDQRHIAHTNRNVVLADWLRSEEHTSELQSRENLV